METLFNMIENAKIAPIHTETKTAERHYWKCSDCLRPFVVAGKDKPEICSCGGKVYYMGKVMGSNYGHTETCECNEVCACARGPNCSCACGGKNHGKGLTVELEVIDGKISVLSSDAQHEQQGAEYRNALALATARYEKRFGETTEKILRGIWVPQPEWYARHQTLKALAAAKAGKIHKVRLERLARILPEIQVDTPKMEEAKTTLF